MIKNRKPTIVKSSLLNDDDWIKLWEILGRISDDSDNKINPSGC